MKRSGDGAEALKGIESMKNLYRSSKRLWEKEEGNLKQAREQYEKANAAKSNSTLMERETQAEKDGEAQMMHMGLKQMSNQQETRAVEHDLEHAKDRQSESETTKKKIWFRSKL